MQQREPLRPRKRTAKLALAEESRDPPPRMWCVYLLRCGDGTLYTGITNDLERRLAAHRAGRGARYTRGRKPLRLLHTEAASSRSEAQRREQELKRLRRRDKLAFLDTLRRRG